MLPIVCALSTSQEPQHDLPHQAVSKPAAIHHPTDELTQLCDLPSCRPAAADGALPRGGAGSQVERGQHHHADACQRRDPADARDAGCPAASRPTAGAGSNLDCTRTLPVQITILKP